MSCARAVHHIELWTRDLSSAEPAFAWLLDRLGWSAEHDPDWPSGRIWRHPSGAYLVLEQSPHVRDQPHDRLRPGMNHLALCAADRETLDRIRAECAAHGWRELFAEAYPHAGGPQHTALFLEHPQGFEIELVAEADGA